MEVYNSLKFSSMVRWGGWEFFETTRALRGSLKIKQAAAF
jgi:hypothetical protein